MSEIKRLRSWINDLQTGLYINCVYCGHRYGPKEVEIPADALRRHVASCPEHPLSDIVDTCQAIIDTIEQQEAKNMPVGGRVKAIKCLLEDAIKRATS